MAKNNRNPVQSQPQKAAVQEVRIQGQSFTGPLPPPAVLQGFESVVPGAAERIIKMAEEESAHRRAYENRALQADIDAHALELQNQTNETQAIVNSERLGKILGFVVTALCISGAIYSVYMGNISAVLGFLAFPVASIVQSFIKH